MTDNETETKPFTASSLAEKAGVDFSYIARLCRQGKIKAEKVGPIWFIRYEEGKHWLEERAARLSKED